jgi:hypothetical protein
VVLKGRYYFFEVKNTVGAILFLFCAVSSTAQRSVVNNLTTFDDKRLHFGFSLGINTFDLGISHYATIGEGPYGKIPVADRKVDPYIADGIDDNSVVRADLPKLVPGFSVGIVSSLRMGNYFDLRFLPGMSFGERRLVYNFPIHDSNSDNYIQGDAFYSIKSTYLDFPLLIKYKSNRINNQRPYILAGSSYRVDISKTGVEDLVRLKRGSFHAEFGIGWDSYLQFFRLSTEFKVSLGLNNILDLPGRGQFEYYGYAFDRLTSNIFTLSFHFE